MTAGQAGAVTTLLINRPERRNALDHASVKALSTAIADAEAEATCRCIVLRGAGGTFSSGRDLADARHDAPLAEILAYDEDWTDVLHLLAGLSKPSVAIVEGHAVAGGFTLAMGCDFVVAERGAKFGALEMRGGFPAAVNTAVLSHLAGPRVALEYLLSADTFAAEHLFRNRLVQPHRRRPGRARAHRRRGGGAPRRPRSHCGGSSPRMRTAWPRPCRSPRRS